jgi:hypothetical protein
MAQRPVVALSALAMAGASALLALVAPAIAPVAGAASAPKSGIKVRVLGQGTPVGRVVVRVRADDGTTPENWPPTAKAVGEDSTKADGTIVFSDVPPGRYVVVAPCNKLPGDWIGGSSATVVEVLPGRPTTTTLTLRRGGHIKGKVLGESDLLAKSAVRTETPTALASGCPMLAPSSIGSDGSFEVAKVPLDAKSIVRIEVPFGEGTLLVSQEFSLEKPETATGTWQLPSVEPDQLGTGRVTLRDDKGNPMHKGTVEFSLRQSSPTWRYVVAYPVGEAAADTVTLAKSLPPGRYFVRAWPDPGANPWWMASPDSLTIEPGKTAKLRLKARIREPGT